MLDLKQMKIALRYSEFWGPVIMGTDIPADHMKSFCWHKPSGTWCGLSFWLTTIILGQLALDVIVRIPFSTVASRASFQVDVTLRATKFTHLNRITLNSCSWLYIWPWTG